MADLTGKVAFVTGAAQGIGLGITEEFLKQGASVALADYNEETLTKTVDKLKETYGDRAWGVVADVSNSEKIDECLQKVVAHFGHLDYAMNNAGGGILKPFAELTDDDFAKTVNVDLFGTFYCMRSEIKVFLEQGYGSIVNTGALGSIYNPGGMGAYNAAKNGVIGMTRAAATDYADKNIRVNCVAPGLTKTALNAGGFLEEVLPTVPMKRAESIEEVAKLFVFVASEATFMTGQTILSDGGASVGLK